MVFSGKGWPVINAQEKMKCVPDGWCSENYRIRTADGEGKVSFSTSQLFGTINRRWELKDGETVVLSATKKLGFKRVVKIKDDKSTYTLARKPGSEAMILEGGSTSACFQRTHPLTRRHDISGHWADDCLVIFAFWFVAYFDQIDSVVTEIVNGVIQIATIHR